MTHNPMSRSSLLFTLLILMGGMFLYSCSDDVEILSNAERRWLTENQSRITLAIESSYAPFVFIDDQDQPNGLAHDYMRLLEEKLGVHFKEERFSSLDAIFSRIKIRNGEILIANAITKTPRRDEFLAFTEPFITVPNVIVVRKERTATMSEEDLRGLKVSLVKSYAITEQLTSQGLGFEPDLVGDDLSGLLNVAFGHSDAVVIDLASASYLIDEKGITNLRVAGEAGLAIKLALGVPKHELILQGILQKGLNAITAAERQEIHNRWISTLQIIPEGLVHFALTLCVLLVVAATFLLLLKRQVRQRTSEILRSQSELQASEARFRHAIAEAPFPIMIYAEDGEILSLNRTWAELTGYTLTEIPTIAIWEEKAYGLHSPADAGEGARTLYELEQRQEEGESCITCKDGSQLIWDFSSSSLGSLPDGRHMVMSMAADVTVREKTEKELRAKNVELERFTYTVSHDLKSPLITIQSYSGMIKQDIKSGNDERALSDLTRIEGAAAKMTALLNDLLKLSRAGKVMNPPSPIDMNQLIKNVLAQLAGPIDAKEIKVMISPDLPETIGDYERVAEIFQNLIENASKYMGEQTAPCIKIGAQRDEKEITFFIQDNGIGIDPRFHENIFGLFHKLAPHSEGTGVGLALVKRIVEVQGGRVWVESTGAGQGSTFFLTLPAKTA